MDLTQEREKDPASGDMLATDRGDDATVVERRRGVIERRDSLGEPALLVNDRRAGLVRRAGG